MRLDALHKGLMRTLGTETAASFIVTEYAGNARFARRTEAVSPELTQGQHNRVDEAILAALGEYLFSPVGELSRVTCLLCSTVHQQLMQLPRFAVFLLRWVLHSLMAEQNKVPIDMPGELL
jgi:hypothetical protein